MQYSNGLCDLTHVAIACFVILSTVFAEEESERLRQVGELEVPYFLSPCSLSISPDGSSIAFRGPTADQLTVRTLKSPLFDVAGVKQPDEVIHMPYYWDLKWMPDSMHLVCSGRDLILWNVKEGHFRQFLSQHADPRYEELYLMAVSPTGQHIAGVEDHLCLSGNSRQIRRWSPKGRMPIDSFEVSGVDPVSLDFIGGEHLLAAATKSGIVHLIDCKSKKPISEIDLGAILEQKAPDLADNEIFRLSDTGMQMLADRKSLRGFLRLSKRVQPTWVLIAAEMMADADNTRKLALTAHSVLPQEIDLKTWKCSADGKLVAVADDSGNGWLLDAASMKILARFGIPPDLFGKDDWKYFNLLEFDPRSTMLVSGLVDVPQQQGKVIFWKVPPSFLK